MGKNTAQKLHSIVPSRRKARRAENNINRKNNKNLLKKKEVKTSNYDCEIDRIKLYNSIKYKIIVTKYNIYCCSTFWNGLKIIV